MKALKINQVVVESKMFKNDFSQVTQVINGKITGGMSDLGIEDYIKKGCNFYVRDINEDTIANYKKIETPTIELIRELDEAEKLLRY